MMMNQRELFEKWCQHEGVKLHDEEADLCWNAWQAATESQWQPIETAPKDGSRVLGASKMHGEWRVEEVWHCRHYGFDGGQYGEPEFWMPLPPEPTK